jgi:hypothetical protein
MIKYNNYPFDEIVKAVEENSRKGWMCYQKFTCAGCGQRLTMDVPNVLFEQGTCDKCSATTNIKKDGCNYMMTHGLSQEIIETASKKR